MRRPTEITDEGSVVYSGSPFAVEDVVVGFDDETERFVALGEGVEAILGSVDLVDPGVVFVLPGHDVSPISTA